MSRIAWFAAGAVAGAYGLLKTRRAARVLSPESLAARAAAVNAGLRTLAGEVSAATAARRDELHERLRTAAVAGAAEAPALTAAGTRQMTPRPASSSPEGDQQMTGALRPHGDG